MKLKDMKEKHDHKFTDLLKVGIFALLMIAPLFASISQMLYATFNKNAHESYYGETINEETRKNINNVNLLIQNQRYNMQTSNLICQSSGNFNVAVNNLTGLPNSANDSRINRLNIASETSGIIIRFYEGNIYIDNYPITNLAINNISFNFVSYANGTTTLINDILSTNFLYKIEYNKYSYLDNAFYYGVDQMTKSDLFNWTQNTTIYAGVKAMTDNLQIQTPAIAILIVYWFILTIIYIIIDIVIKCFTAMTHLI